MKTIIVEDEILVAEHISDILAINNIETIKMVQTVTAAQNTFNLKPSFYILDIRLANDQNGIDFARELHRRDIPFIFITANNETEIMKEAVKTRPVAYITKPFKERDILAAIELVKLYVDDEIRISIIGKNGKEDILENDIQYCEADGMYTKLHLRDKSITQRINLSELEQKLSNKFIRTHRSFMVNVNAITSRKASVLYINDIEIPVSRKFKDSVAEHFKAVD